MARRPTAKKKLKAKSITAAMMPHAVPPSYTVPARIAMQQHCPIAAKSISFRLPSRSIVQIGTSEEAKYAMPLNPANSSDRL